MPPAPADKLAPAVPEEYLKPGTTLSLVPAGRRGAAQQSPRRARPGPSRARRRPRSARSARCTSRTSRSTARSCAQKQASTVGGQFTFLQTTYGPSVAASWLLFDFGGREADVEEATRALYAADWTHNAAIQDVVLLGRAGVLPLPEREGARDRAPGEPRRGAAQPRRRRGAAPRGRRDDRRRAAGAGPRPRRSSSSSRTRRDSCRSSAARSRPRSAFPRTSRSTSASCPRSCRSTWSRRTWTS